jgi:tryptophan synthase alpha chain
MNGLERIQTTFQQTAAQGRAALMPYFTVGFPSLHGSHSSQAILEAIAASGADLIELGIPFSDPLADGPTIQRSTQTALAQGTRVADCIEAARQLRAQGATQALLLMGYINPILSFGPQHFVQAAAEAGVDGLIIPDLPVEEGEEIEALCRAQGLALVYMLAPTSTPQRMALVAAHASGFIYLVSVAGVTGAREDVPPGLAEFVSRVRQVSELPLAVGFGIATPHKAQLIGKLADGVIVGSAMISRAEGNADPSRSVGQFVRELRAAVG